MTGSRAAALLGPRQVGRLTMPSPLLVVLAAIGGSLLLGIPGPDGLQYAGRVGSGFSDSTLAKLTEVLTPLRTHENPFVGIPAVDASDALWVRPEVVGEVEFAEFTPDGILRHSRWRGLRPDKSPDEVVRES